MYILLIISFSVIALAAGYLLKTRLSDMLPLVWCGLILVLYVLSFGRMLNWIDVILPVAAVLFAVPAFLRGGKKSNGTDADCVTSDERCSSVLRYCREELTSAAFLTYLILAVLITAGVWDKTVTWWDDINYWASDLKSLYYLNGFASKYANVSPEFGDYPPGVQLAKWFAVHADRQQFREGLAFAGYYLFNFSFALPILGRAEEALKGIRHKKSIAVNLLVSVPAAIIMWLLPGIADKYGYAGFCADLSMAFVFGAVLIASADIHKDNALFDHIRVMLCLSVLVICKSTGAIWALFGIIFWMGVRLIAARNEEGRTGRKLFRGLLSVAAAPVAVGASWMGFCLLRHRVTKTTSTMVTYITTDKYGLSEYTGQFAKAFVKAFLSEPLHVDHTWIDLPPVAFLILLTAVFIILYKKKYLQAGIGRFASISLPVMGIVYYGVIFLAHITIFATETQYLEASAMAASIERYGVPFMLGSILLASWIFLGKEPESGKRASCRLIAFGAAVLLLTDIPAAYKGLIGYRYELEADMAARDEMITDDSRAFLETIGRVFPEGNVRVCRLHDGGYYRVADTYTAYEASPVSVMSISYDLKTVDAGTIISSVNQTHAVYLYADEQNAGEDTCLDEMTETGKFEYGRIYRISYEGGGMVLYPVD